MRNISLRRLSLTALMVAKVTCGYGATPPVVPPPTPVPVPTVVPMRQVVLSKDASGPIMPGHLDLSLRANAASDQTQKFIPDGSRLMSDDFLLPAGGVGRFEGSARLVGVDGKTLMGGILHGIAGLTTQRGDGTKSEKPGHLEGFFEAGYAPIVTGGGTGTVGPNGSVSPPGIPPIPIPGPPPPPLPHLLSTSFSADIFSESASPLPLYRAHLDGLLLLPPLPPSSPVSIAPDSLSYVSGDPITAIIANPTHRPIYAYDEQSLCTIVQLQSKSATGWTTQFPCALGRPPRQIKIAAGETIHVALQPLAGSPGIMPGRYRLVLTYFVSPTAATAGATILSPIFSVTATPPPTGSVTVTPDKPIYGTAGVIVATIENGTDHDIETYDHQSFCTVLSLMQNNPTGWHQVSGCQILTPSMRVVIKAHAKLQVSLPQVVPAIFPPLPNFAPGTYRLDLSFIPLNAHGLPDGATQTASSATFPIAVSDPLPGPTGVPAKR